MLSHLLGNLIFTSFIFVIVNGSNIYDRNSLGLSALVGETIPSNTHIAIYENNTIQEVPVGIFVASLNVLGTIRLDYNQIYSISSGAFIQVPTVRHLKLSYNKLRVIDGSMWTGLVNLENLYLGHNEVRINTAQWAQVHLFNV